MIRPRHAAAVAGLMLALLAVGIVTARGGSRPRDAPASPAIATAHRAPLHRAPRHAPRRRVPRAADVRRGGWSGHLLRAAMLRDTPGGRRVARVGLTTGYGLSRVFAVAAVRRDWVGVRALQQPNGRLAWLPAGALRLEPVRTTLVADLSDRELTVRIDGRVRDRAPVGIGRTGSTTPVGRYGVTDRLRVKRGSGTTYGCCIIPLTGHQPHPPPGWTGGTRLALHGTPAPGSVGQEVSAGCLRMRDEDLRRVLARVPLGATLIVRP